MKVEEPAVTDVATGYRHLIAGELVDADRPDGVDIVDPATELIVARVPAATVAETERAVSAARRSFDSGVWSRADPAYRAAVLRRFAEEIDARRAELIRIALLQTGALIGLARSLQVGSAIDAAFRYADLARSREPIEHSSVGGPPFSDEGTGVWRVVERAPAGVVAAITPFNYPTMMNVQKIFPALATGCSVVLKPNPTTSWDAALLAEAGAAAGLPAGVLSILLGGGADVGEHLAAHVDVDVVSFTGSTEVGKRLMVLGAPTVKRLLLELGGKSPNIVFADADLEGFLATDPGNLRHAGQGCGQLTRLLVERPIYDEVVSALGERLRGMVVGPPEDPSTELGPVANAAQRDRVLRYVDIGRSEGARLVTGGGVPAHLERGYYVEPTLFADVDNRMRIAQEEIFGPVPVVIPFDGTDAAIATANASDYGLNAAVWTGDRDRAWYVAGRLRTGNVGVNTLADLTQGPHGGFKQTGIGREWWQWSLEEYTELKGYSYRPGVR